MEQYVLPCPKVAKGQSCAPCADLDIINQEISEAEQALSALKSKRRLVYERMNHAHDPLSSNLPAEVLSKIFTTILPGNIHGQYNIYLTRAERTRATTTTPFLLGAVCGMWRAIACSTPQLWTSIFVDLRDINTTLLDLLRECLLRSGQLPLYLRLDGPSDHSKIGQAITDQFFEEVNSHSERWFDLELRLPSKLLSYLHSDSTNDLILNTLDILIHNPDMEINLGKAFNVRNLYMHTLQVSGFLLAWENLKTVSVVVDSVDMCFELFSKASSMTHCTFHLDTHNSRTTRNTILRHDHLISLHVDYQKTSAPTDVFLSLMELPALKHLDINVRGAIDPGALQHLLSTCSLKTLKVIADHVGLALEGEIIPILETVTSLESLECVGFYPVIAVDPLLIWLSKTSTLEGSASLPNLKILHIEGMKMSWNYVLAVILAHLHNAPTNMLTGIQSHEQSERRQFIRPLQSLHILLTRSPYPFKPIDRDVAQKIQRATVDHGFEVTIGLENRQSPPQFINFLNKSLQSESPSEM